MPEIRKTFDSVVEQTLRQAREAASARCQESLARLCPAASRTQAPGSAPLPTAAEFEASRAALRTEVLGLYIARLGPALALSLRADAPPALRARDQLAADTEAAIDAAWGQLQRRSATLSRDAAGQLFDSELGSFLATRTDDDAGGDGDTEKDGEGLLFPFPYRSLSQRCPGLHVPPVLSASCACARAGSLLAVGQWCWRLSGVQCSLWPTLSYYKVCAGPRGGVAVRRRLGQGGAVAPGAAAGGHAGAVRWPAPRAWQGAAATPSPCPSPGYARYPSEQVPLV